MPSFSTVTLASWKATVSGDEDHVSVGKEGQESQHEADEPDRPPVEHGGVTDNVDMRRRDPGFGRNRSGCDGHGGLSHIMMVQSIVKRPEAIFRAC